MQGLRDHNPLPGLFVAAYGLGTIFFGAPLAKTQDQDRTNTKEY
jgi:hypothetical protein